MSKLKVGLIAGILALTVGAGVSLAAMSADDAIKGRQACMKQGHGGVMKVAVPIMKGEAPFDAAALKAAYDGEDAACKDWDAFWAPGTEKGTVETHALPAIWTDKEGFAAAGKAWYDAATKLRAATDEASFKAAFPAVGAACKGCHEKFRAAD
ncbi:c-type cytochrome [Aestuariivirga litoralis]|uniref:c-type cytochrome n=1 Tax=Aestuariivirga litoralis TaxID=2650924 RepID=UPI0018C45404|nr:cytochrome c [Aestuariivirga litoralis]MBG1232786.1 cytochrome c [Aestuariivirga litoralis]